MVGTRATLPTMTRPNDGGNGPFSGDVTHTQKFDYYSVDHAWGGSTSCQMYYVL